MKPEEKVQKELDEYKKKYEDLQQQQTELSKKHEDAIADLNAKHAEEVEKLATKIQKESPVPVTDTQAKQEAEAALSQAKPQSVTSLTLGMATANQVTTDYGVHAAHANDVKFDVTDPKDTGMPKGITVVSKESGEHFEKLGIGKIVK